MLDMIISGGQSGADQAGWRAAKSAGIPTSGWLPRGCLTEDGPRPEFIEMYGAREHGSSLYPPRTEANVVLAEKTLWFGKTGSAGFHCTRNAARKHFKSFWEIGKDPAEMIANRIIMLNVNSINVAGNRESTNPGIGALVEAYLTEVFRIVKEIERS